MIYVPASLKPSIIAKCETVLSPSELTVADELFDQTSRGQFILRRAFRRYCAAIATDDRGPLASISFSETDKGQPYISDRRGPFYSFAACRLGLISAWSQHKHVGVDIEDPTRPVEPLALAKQYFTETEQTLLERVDDNSRTHLFFCLWTLKEAALKSIGEGLSFGLKEFEFSLGPPISILHAPAEFGGAAYFSAHLLPESDGCAALVVRS